MRRRDLLRGAGGLAAIAGVSGATWGGGQDGEPYAPLGRVEVDGTTEAVVGDDGTTVYVAAGDGFATVDVSDAAAPAVLAERRDLLPDREDGPMDGIRDVKVEGDRLLVVGPANHDGGVPNGVLVYDVADPADPRQVAFHETGDFIHNCFLHDGVAYFPQGGANHRLHAVDVSGDEPVRLSEWGPPDHDPAWEAVDPGLRNIHDVWVQDDRAYLAGWDAGTFVLDVSDPADPSLLARIADYTVEELTDRPNGERLIPPGNHHYVQPSDDGSLLGINRESWALRDGRGGPGGVELWDVSSLSEPERLAHVPAERARDETYSGTWTTSHNFEFAGDRLYTSWYQGGVKLHDVSDPANPEQLAWWRDPEEAAFWTARSAAGDVFVASSTAAAPALSDCYEGLYTFPDRPGEQADPPSIPTETPTASPAPTDATPITPTPSPTPSPTETATATPDSVSGDGFGLLAALAALAGTAWWRRRGD